MVGVDEHTGIGFRGRETEAPYSRQWNNLKVAQDLRGQLAEQQYVPQVSNSHQYFGLQQRLERQPTQHAALRFDSRAESHVWRYELM